MGGCSLDRNTDASYLAGLRPAAASHRTFSCRRAAVSKKFGTLWLYLNPPDELVGCVDEKSQIQGWIATQPAAADAPGQVERPQPDYFRHGTTSLFAAWIQERRIIGQLHRRHRPSSSQFLDTIRRGRATELAVHLILDNSAPQDPMIHRWLARRPRFHLPLHPTVVRGSIFVGKLVRPAHREQIKRGAHRSTRTLEAAILEYIALHNTAPSVRVDEDGRRDLDQRGSILSSISGTDTAGSTLAHGRVCGGCYIGLIDQRARGPVVA